jgi:hypothetical protein
MSVHNIRTETMVPGDVYIGRRHPKINPEATDITPGADGYFGNPFRIGRTSDREEAIRLFEAHARIEIAVDAEYRARVKALRNKRLFCYCAPLACHGHVLERLAAELNGVTS